MSHERKEVSNSGPITRFANPRLVACPHAILTTIARQGQIQLIPMKSYIDVFEITKNEMMDTLKA